MTGASFQIQPAKAQPTPVPKEEAKPEVPIAPTRVAPDISLGEKDKTPAILGSSIYKNANVLLTFVPVVGSKLFITGTTGDDGSFILAVPQALRNGPYAVNAVVVLGEGSQSDPSNILTVEVGGVFVANVSWEDATYISLFLIILLLTLIGYLVSRRHFSSRKNSSGSIKKGVTQAEDAVHKSFTLLRQDMSDHVKGKTLSGKADTQERADISNFKKDLADAEEYINKEIEGIESMQSNEKN